MAKQVGTGGVTGGGLSLNNYYAKTKKKLALFIWNVWSLLGYSYPLGKGKPNPHFAHLDVCRASFEVECHITMPLFPVIGLGGESALQVHLGLCLFSGFFFSVCRFSFADREITPFYAASMVCRAG